ncbi:MAG: hypothetical protein ACI8ZW_000473 [Yoonia sp.]|jgi:hypothetical protein
MMRAGIKADLLRMKSILRILATLVALSALNLTADTVDSGQIVTFNAGELATMLKLTESASPKLSESASMLTAHRENISQRASAT